MITQQTRLAEEISRLREERDAHRKAHDEVDLRWRAEGARAAKFEQALREIADMVPNAGSENQPVYIARRALENV